jgi:transcriptional regulator with XRE-family HTH domain
MATSSPLQNIRKARTLTQEQLAGLLGIRQQSYAAYEKTGKRRVVPSVDVQARIAAILGTSIEALWPPDPAGARGAASSDERVGGAVL